MRELIKRETIEGALIIAVICSISSLPYLWYLCFIGMRERLSSIASQVLVSHLWCILVISFLCGAFGLAWGRGCGLVGIVDWPRLKISLPILFLFGFIVGMGSFLLIDRHLSIYAPYLYPSNPIFSITIPFKSAFFGEVIRFGGMALISRLLRNIHLSNLTLSIFFLYLGIRSLRFIDPGFILEWWVVIGLGWGLLVNLAMGYMYARIGILSTILVQFVAGWRFFLFT